MYQYRYKTTRGEYWKMSMYFIYHSMTGMVNLVFTAALLALTFAKWGSSGNIFRICMVLGCCLFTIFQPLAIYLSAGKLASASGEDTEIRLDDVGIQVKVGNTYDKIPWRKIVRIAKPPSYCPHRVPSPPASADKGHHHRGMCYHRIHIVLHMVR